MSVITTIMAAKSRALRPRRRTINPPKKSEACSGLTGISFWMYVSTPSPRKMKNVMQKLSAKLNVPKRSGPR